MVEMIILRTQPEYLSIRLLTLVVKFFHGSPIVDEAMMFQTFELRCQEKKDQLSVDWHPEEVW